MATKTRTGSRTSGGHAGSGGARGDEAAWAGDPTAGAPGVAAGPDLTAVLTDPAPDPSWVDASPFRAHVRHLMAVGSLDVLEVSVLLGLPTRSVRHLLDGRSGRPTRRISPWTARRLLLVRVTDVRHLRWTLTPADTASVALTRLRARGWSDEEVAEAVGFGVGELSVLTPGTRCSRLLSVRVVGLARRLPGTVDDEDLALAVAA